jgi:uncharacterized protein (TIGR03086 family)
MSDPDLVDLYARVLACGGRVVGSVAPDRRLASTPCSAWTVENLLDHMVGTVRASVDFLEGRQPDYDPAAPKPVIGDAPADVFDEAVAAALAAWRIPGALEREIDAPGGRMPAGMFLHFPLMDVWVHSWDLATALGQRVDFDTDITEYVLGFCQQAFGQNRPPVQMIGPEVDVDAAAPAMDRLVAFLGRVPS